MAAPIPVADPVWRRAVDDALDRTGELVALVMHTSAGGARDWFLVRDPALHERGLWPHGEEFVAYGVLPDGAAQPGAY